MRRTYFALPISTVSHQPEVCRRCGLLLNVGADVMVDTGVAHMASSEIAFLAGEEPITIVARIRLDSLQFICGDLPELKPSIPAVVPMWVAMFLRKREKCRIVTPAWMEADTLLATLDDERRHQDRFAPLPYNYIEIAKDLMQYASEVTLGIEPGSCALGLAA